MADIVTSDFSTPGNMASSTAGSKHLAIAYGARVLESKRCLFCLSSPCKANLEIQLKFDQVRVSLDWILSGFVPEVEL
ncbi:hypothetical protein BG000_002000 [Podila horticola]|nr:hypothetical protein BG003_000360 [Podila horticola]KAG0324936.1 hypothetical protein BG000_002000 [Podila horticola]